jgi:hypothetical protein
MTGVLAVTMNDSAARLLEAVSEFAVLCPSDGLAPGLRDRLDRGIAHRRDVLVWPGSVGSTANAPWIFPDLTGWECADSSFHLEDYVPVTVDIIDDEPRISEPDQRALLQHGIAFALQFRRLVYELDEPVPVRCIISANDTNATFRFHQIRPGESWNNPNLDAYLLDKVVTLEISPHPGAPEGARSRA